MNHIIPVCGRHARRRALWRHPIACFVVLAACAASIAGSKAIAQTARIRIPVAVSLTGSGQSYGVPAVDGARLAVEEANEGGAAPQIALTVHDDGSDPERGRAAARQIIAGDATVVVGPATTPMGLAVAPVLSEAGLAAIGTTATGDSLTANASFFRASFSTGDGGEALAHYLRVVLGVTRAAVLFKDDGYGQPVAEGFRRGADRPGMETTFHAFKTRDEAQQAARLVAADPGRPGIVLAMLDVDAVPILTTLRRAGVKGPILGTNAIAGEFVNAAFADQPEARKQPGYFTDGVYAASPLILDSANAETLAFAARFRARFGHDPSYIAAQGYESMRLAIAAARAASEGAAGDIAARRTAARAYLASLDGPAHAVPGLQGPLWFTPERGRRQPLRIGRFQNGAFESAPAQLVPVRNPDPKEIATGAVVEISPDRYVRRQQVVYTGLFLNEIARLDIAQSRFTADFYLWLRFARDSGPGAADPTAIEFPDLVRGSSDGKQLAVQRDLDDGTTYRLWQIRGDFKNDFDLHRYPADAQTLVVRFFNAHAATDRLVYVLDRRAFHGDVSAPPAASRARAAANATHAEPETGAGTGVASDAFRNLTQWDVLATSQRRDSLLTKSALGDPGLVGLERVRELSGFNLTISLQRRVLATLAKTLLPLGLMTLIMYASLHFPVALVNPKVMVAITGALSGAVLLSAINAQLGGVGYVMAVEYGFYVFFILCLLCIVTILGAERLRVGGKANLVAPMERMARYLFILSVAATVAAGLAAYAYA